MIIRTATQPPAATRAINPLTAAIVAFTNAVVALTAAFVAATAAFDAALDDHLVDEHGDENVLWVSQFAKEENVNLDGSDKYGYDIEYYVGGIKHYVEVKTNSSSLPTVAFNLPTSEREFAETHDNYQICVVTATRTDSPRITFYPWMDVKGFANTPTGYWVEFNQQEAIT